jgi:plasmid maintenance system antidote protein VapI
VNKKKNNIIYERRLKMKTKFAELMKKYKYTQTKLSKISNVCQSNISIYCNYQKALESSTTLTRIRLSKAFQMTLQEFENALELKPSTKFATNKQEIEDYIQILKEVRGFE